MRLTASLVLLAATWSLTVGSQQQPAAPDVGKYSLVLEPSGHVGTIVKVLFTRDNKETITVSEDRTVRFWDTETGEHLRVLRLPTSGGNEGVPHAAALSPDGTVLAVGGAGPIHLIRLPEGKLEKRSLPPMGVIALDFSPVGKRLAAVNDDGVVRVWNLDNADPPLTLYPGKKAPKQGKAVLAFSPDGQSLVAWGGQARNVWNLKTEKKSATLTKAGAPEGGGLAAPRWVGWHPDGTLFATVATGGGGNGTLNFWKPDGTKVDSIGDVWHAAFLRDGRLLMLTTGKGRELRLIDPSTRKRLKTFQTDVDKFQRFDVSPDGKLAALYRIPPQGETYDVQLLHIADDALGAVLGPTFRDRGSAPAGFNRKGTAIARAFHQKSFHFFDLQTLQPGSVQTNQEVIQTPIVKRAGAVLEVEGGPANQTLKIVPQMGEVVVMNLPTRITLKGGHAPYTFVDNHYVAAGAANGELMLFDAKGKLQRRIKAHRANVASVAPSPDGRFVVSKGDDHLLCIWNITEDRPLLYLYGPSKLLGTKLENEWVVWTPQGYYAASQGGEKLIGWQVDNGPDQLGGFYTLDRFRKTFHRPDVIGRLLEYGTVEKALAAADRERGVKTEKVPIEDALPPQVTLVAPVAGMVVKGKVAVQAKAVSQGKFPVVEVQLLLDGRPVSGGLHKVAKPKLGEAQVPPWIIELPPGSHELSVLARTAVSTNQSDPIPVASAAAAVLKSALYVLAIGINDYPKGWTLNCAENDAKAIEALFKAQKQKAFRDVQTKLLTKDATKQNIEKGFAWLQGKMLPQDVAVIFYAGHGMNKKGTFFLLPQDTNFDEVEATAIEGEWLKKRLTEMPGRILVLFDACHSVAPGTRIDPPRIDRLARDLSDEDCGVVVMCAASAREPSGEDKQLGHGYFTYAVIQGLSGNADTSKKDGQVYLHHLDSYVYERVVEMSGDAQHPVIGRPTSVRTFALAKPK